MEKILLRKGVLREPPSECGVIEACAEVEDVEGDRRVPLLALVLLGLEGRIGARGQRAAQGVVVVGGAVGEGDGLREVYLVPDDGADAPGGSAGASVTLQGGDVAVEVV